MEQTTVQARPRTAVGKGPARQLRQAGRIPGVVYGKGIEPTPLEVDDKEFRFALHHGAEAGLIGLTLEGREGEPISCLVKEVQRHPVSRKILSVDFQQVSLTEKITTTVPVLIAGESAAIKQGCIVEQTLHELDIECLPTDIPAEIPADISGLGPHESLHVRDIVPPPGVTLLNDPEEAVVVIAVPRVVEPTLAVEAEPAAAEEGQEKEPSEEE